MTFFSIDSIPFVGILNFNRTTDCVMISGNIDNGFSKWSYLSIGTDKHHPGMEIVTVTGMKFVYAAVYAVYDHYVSCLCGLRMCNSVIYLAENTENYSRTAFSEAGRMFLIWQDRN